MKESKAKRARPRAPSRDELTLGGFRLKSTKRRDKSPVVVWFYGTFFRVPTMYRRGVASAVMERMAAWDGDRPALRIDVNLAIPRACWIESIVIEDKATDRFFDVRLATPVALQAGDRIDWIDTKNQRKGKIGVTKRRTENVE